MWFASVNHLFAEPPSLGRESKMFFSLAMRYLQFFYNVGLQNGFLHYSRIYDANKLISNYFERSFG